MWVMGFATGAMAMMTVRTFSDGDYVAALAFLLVTIFYGAVSYNEQRRKG